MRWVTHLLQQLQTGPAVLVSVLATRGSVPRDVGTWMAVFAADLVATVGGGCLEQGAIVHARALLVRGPGAPEKRTYALGPSLGQCCGGDVQLHFEWISAQDAATLAKRLAPAHTPVALFGGGHVGQALVRVLGMLPVDVLWVDSRDEVFPKDLPAHVRVEHSEPVEAAVPGLAAGSRVFIMSFSHAEDFKVLATCLLRQRSLGDLPYIGLIGSKTKWATFRHRLEARGFSAAELDQVTCPIGVPGIADKRPEVIAIAAAAQLLQMGA